MRYDSAKMSKIRYVESDFLKKLRQVNGLKKLYHQNSDEFAKRCCYRTRTGSRGHCKTFFEQSVNNKKTNYVCVDQRVKKMVKKSCFFRIFQNVDPNFSQNIFFPLVNRSKTRLRDVNESFEPAQSVRWHFKTSSLPRSVKINKIPLWRLHGRWGQHQKVKISNIWTDLKNRQEPKVLFIDKVFTT